MILNLDQKIYCYLIFLLYVPNLIIIKANFYPFFMCQKKYNINLSKYYTDIDIVTKYDFNFFFQYVMVKYKLII